MLHELERKIFVDEVILKDEYSYLYGANKDVAVYFQYYNIKHDRDGKKFACENYGYALWLARDRARDGRYKNYEFLLTTD